MASKSDVELVRADLKSEIELVRVDLKSEIGLVRADLKAEIELVRADLRQMKTELDGRITALDSRVTLLQWMMGLSFALTAAVLGKLLFGH